MCGDDECDQFDCLTTFGESDVSNHCAIYNLDYEDGLCIWTASCTRNGKTTIAENFEILLDDIEEYLKVCFQNDGNPRLMSRYDTC